MAMKELDDKDAITDNLKSVSVGALDNADDQSPVALAKQSIEQRQANAEKMDQFIKKKEQSSVWKKIFVFVVALGVFTCALYWLTMPNQSAGLQEQRDKLDYVLNVTTTTIFDNSTTTTVSTSSTTSTLGLADGVAARLCPLIDYETDVVQEYALGIAGNPPQNFSSALLAAIYQSQENNVRVIVDAKATGKASSTLNARSGTQEDQILLAAALVKASGGDAKLGVSPGCNRVLAFAKVAETEYDFNVSKAQIKANYWNFHQFAITNYTSLIDASGGYWLALDPARGTYPGDGTDCSNTKETVLVC